MEFIKDFEKKIKGLDVKISDEEFSSIKVGLYDILESTDGIRESIIKINSLNDIEKIHEIIVDIQMELVNHIKRHILDMEQSLINLANNIEEKYLE
jgi:hypothetical protein